MRLPFTINPTHKVPSSKSEFEKSALKNQASKFAGVSSLPATRYQPLFQDRVYFSARVVPAQLQLESPSENDQRQADVIRERINAATVSSGRCYQAKQIKRLKNDALKIELIELGLPHPNRSIHRGATEAVETLNSDVEKVRFIKQFIFTGTSKTQSIMAKAIAQIKAPELKEELIKLALTSTNLEVVHQSLLAINSMPTSEQKQALLKHYLASDNRIGDRWIADCLFELKDEAFKSKTLRAMFATNNSETVINILNQIPQIGANDIKLQLITQGLAFNDQDVQERAAKAIKFINDEQTKFDVIVSLLPSENKKVHHAIPDLIGSFKNETVVARLIRACLNDEKLITQLRGAISIQYIDDPDLKTTLILEAYQKSNLEVFERAAKWSKHLLDEKHLKPLIPLILELDDPDLLRNALDAIDKITDEVTRASFIRKALTCESNSILMIAAAKIALIKDPEIKRDLITGALNHDSLEVQKYGGKASITFDDDALRLQYINKAFTSDSAMFVIEALQAVRKLKNEKLKAVLITKAIERAQPEVRAKASAQIESINDDALKAQLIKQALDSSYWEVIVQAAKAIKTLNNDVLKKDCIDIAVTTLGQDIAVFALEAVATFTDENVILEFVNENMSNESTMKELTEYGHALAKVNNPDTDLIKQNLMQTLMGRYNVYPSGLVASFNAPKRLNHWVHLGLLSEDDAVQKEAVEAIKRLPESNLKAQWISMVERDFYLEVTL